MSTSVDRLQWFSIWRQTMEYRQTLTSEKPSTRKLTSLCTSQQFSQKAYKIIHQYMSHTHDRKQVRTNDVVRTCLMSAVCALLREETSWCSTVSLLTCQNLTTGRSPTSVRITRGLANLHCRRTQATAGRAYHLSRFRDVVPRALNKSARSLT